MKPTVGRIVHYVPNYGAAHLAAIITGTYDDNPLLVDLTVFTRGDLGGRVSYPIAAVAANRDETGVIGNTWHWPEREA